MTKVLTLVIIINLVEKWLSIVMGSNFVNYYQNLKLVYVT